MSKEYAENKIREALRMHDGNFARARQQVVSWAYNDPVLLESLTRPHLDGIVAYQVERVASGRAEVESKRPQAPSHEPVKEEEHFGMDLLRAVVSTGVPVFGLEGSSPVKRKTASKQHIDAIHKMASGKRPVPKKNPYTES